MKSETDAIDRANPETSYHPGLVFHPRAFQRRRYIVTGGSRGIGEAAVRMLLSLGASVAVLARDPARLAELQAELGPKHDLLTLSTDVADKAALERAISQCRERWGERLHGLVNNAMLNPRGTLEELSEERFRASWEVNALSAWRLSKACLPMLANAAKSGQAASIVNVSSVMAAQTRAANHAYASSKGALEALTRNLAVELAPARVRVNTLVPGYIRTYEGHAGRNLPREEWTESMKLRAQYIERITASAQPWPTYGRPEDCAAAIVFLLSDASTFITGASLPVDGGFLVDFRHPQDQFLRVQPDELIELEMRAAEAEHLEELTRTGKVRSGGPS